jgi:anti-anti-sigma factor
VTFEHAGERTVMAVDGELDMATVDEFTASLREGLAAGPVLLDLRALAFMDSSGVRALDAVLRDAEGEGWKLTILPEMRANVRQLLTLTGLIAILPFEDPPAEENP